MGVKLDEFFLGLGVELDNASFARAEKALAGVRQGMQAAAARGNAFKSTFHDSMFARGLRGADGWRRGLERVGETTKALQAALVPAGAAIAALGYGLARAFSSVTQHSRDILKMAQSSGLTTDQFQELSYAAEQQGVSMDDLRQSFASLIANARDAADGGENYVKAFQRAGVTVKDAGGKMRPMNDLLFDLSDAFAKMPDGVDKAALAIKLLGEDDGPRLLPFLSQGSKKLRELGLEAHNVGAVLGKETLDATVAAAAAWASLKSSATGLLAEGFGPLMPAIKEGIVELRSWIKANRRDIVAAFGLALKIVGAAFKVILTILKPLVTVLAVLARYFNLIAITLGGALLAALIADGIAFGALGLAAYQTGIAMVVAAAKSAAAWFMAAAPFMLILSIIGLIVLLAEDIWVGMNGGKSVFGLIFNYIDKIPQMLADGVTAALNWWYDKFFEFFDWLGNKIDAAMQKLNPFDIEDNSSSGTRGATVDDPEFAARIRAAGGFARPFAQPQGPIVDRFGVNAGLPSIPAPLSSGGNSVTVGGAVVHVHGVTDPKAVGAVVDKKLAEHSARQAEELHGALGGR
jgi:hypothetical protein